MNHLNKGFNESLINRDCSHLHAALESNKGPKPVKAPAQKEQEIIALLLSSSFKKKILKILQ